jgi:alanine racemase
VYSKRYKTIFLSYTQQTADVFVSNKETNNGLTTLSYQYKGIIFKLQIPFQDNASIENSISCLLVLLYFDYDFATIQSRMSPFSSRNAIKGKKRINNCSIIDDSYSSDFQSLKIALDFLESQKQFSKKTVILSDIFQSGLSTEELYSKVAQLVVSNKISRVIGIGETISQFKDEFVNCITFQTTVDFVAYFDTLDFSNETILIKGARLFQFEEIVHLLEEKTHETVLEINLNAISYNLNFSSLN